MSVLLLVVIVLLAYLAYSYTFTRPHPKFPPGPPRWPIWGGYLQLLLENFTFPHKAMHWMAKRYNTPVLGMYLGKYPTVIACSQEAVHEMLNKPEFQGRVDEFIARVRTDDYVVKGMNFLDGDAWIEQRRFMLRNLRDFGFGTRGVHLEKVVEEEIRDLLDLVQSDVEGISHNGVVTAPSVFYPFYLNITMELLLGTRFPPSQHNKLRDFAFANLLFQTKLDPTTGMLNMTPWVRHVAPYASGFTDVMSTTKEIKTFIKELVAEHKDTFMKDHMRDFCDKYLRQMYINDEAGVKHYFSEDQMVMEMWDLLFPSALAVTSTTALVVMFLLHYPHVQRKMQKEIDDVVGRNRLPTLDDRPKLPYTEAVLREVMRRETLTGLAIPHRCTENTYWYGHFIPKDTMMLPNLWSAHMDEKAWPNPTEFRPERHLEEDGSLRKKNLTNPFGMGKRVCAGETFAKQNMLLMLMSMLQSFNLELPKGKSLPDLEDHVPGLNVSPKPFQVKFVPRI